MKIFLAYNIAEDVVDFYIYHENENKERFIAKVDNEFGTLEYTEFERGTLNIPPTFKLPSLEVPELLKALEEFGVKSKHQSTIEGLYEASQKHLEDMRNLVFKKVNK